jgi:beta-lactamase class A
VFIAYIFEMKIIAMLMLLTLAVSADVDKGLEKQLQREMQSFPGKMGFVAKNLKTGQSVNLGGDEPVPTASTIKLLVYVEAFHQIKDGKKSLSDEITLQKEDQVPGSGVLQFFHTPHKLTLEDAIAMMMIESDNTATNLVIDDIGLANINKRAELMGLKNTYLYKKVYRKAEGPMPPDQKKFGLGKTTAAEAAQIMQSIVECELKDEALCKRMVEIMKNQSYRNMIPRYIEAELDSTEGGSKIADKVGQIDASRSDVAAIWTENGVLIISAYSYENKDQRWSPENEAELTIAKMAQTVFQAWGKAGKAASRVK